jgi:hypothetical protein
VHIFFKLRNVTVFSIDEKNRVIAFNETEESKRQFAARWVRIFSFKGDFASRFFPPPWLEYIALALEVETLYGTQS